MKKVGQPFKRPGKSGWWLRWTDPVNKKRIHKNFHTKAQAEHYRQILYYQLNNDVYPNSIIKPLNEAIEEYLVKYDLQNLADSSKEIAEQCLRRFSDHISKLSVDKITQKDVDSYIAARKQEVSPITVNKDISRLGTFFLWCKEKKFTKQEMKFVPLKTNTKPKKALTNKHIREVLSKCDEDLKMYVLMGLCTGLRKTDLLALQVSDINIKACSIDTSSKKTGKHYLDRPLPDAIKPLLKKYIKGKSGKLFQIVNFKKEIKALNITSQILRFTFSTYIQMTGSISSAKDLLEHYDSKTTEQFYTDQELILRWKVNQLPVNEWLK